MLEDNTRWKGRAQQILEKYERIDPIEHDNLKTSVITLSAEKADLEEKLEATQATIDGKVKEKAERVKSFLRTDKLFGGRIVYAEEKLCFKSKTKG